MATVEQTPVQHRIPRSRSERLADQAATAALYVTHPERSASLRSPIRATEIDPAVLKASGSQPGLSNASAAAALLAHARKQEHGARQAVSPSRDTKHRRTASSINEGYQYHAALAALKEQKASESFGNRRRAETAPSEAARAGAIARLSATTESPGDRGDPFNDLDKYMNASRIKNAHLNPKLFTATPPVPPEVEELRRRSILEAASVSMAKDMYGTMEAREGGAAGVRTRRSASASQPQSATLQQASTNVLGQALNLHDIAQKRAAQRIAGLEDETAAFRDYYGIEPQVQRSSLTVRKRRGSDETEEFDAERSKEIRTQMTALRTRLDAVDERREKDRASLMELARKNVDAAIQDIDERMYAEPGQSVAMQKYLDEKATQRAQKGLEDMDKQTLLADTVNIGGSKYVEMGDVEDLARSRLQPTFDEIDDRAQTQRARDLEARLDEEQRQRLAQLEHEREADIKAEEAKHQEFLKKKQHETKHRAETVWPWKRKSRQLPHDESEVDRTTTERPTEQQANEATAVPSEAARRQTEETTTSEGPDSVLRRESKFRNWFKDRIGRRSSAPPPRETNGTHEEQTAREPTAREPTARDTAAVTGVGGSERAERAERAEGSERVEGPEREGVADRRGKVYQADESEDNYESAAEPATQASRAAKDTSRAAPLRSNPVTAKDLNRPTDIDGASDDDMSKLNGMTPSEYVAVEQDSKDMVKQSESTKHARYSAGSNDELSAPSKEREVARESAAQHSLPAPPTIREVGGSTRRASHSTSVRESRFSEDL